MWLNTLCVHANAIRVARNVPDTRFVCTHAFIGHWKYIYIARLRWLAIIAYTARSNAHINGRMHSRTAAPPKTRNEIERVARNECQAHRLAAGVRWTCASIRYSNKNGKHMYILRNKNNKTTNRSEARAHTCTAHEMRQVCVCVCARDERRAPESERDTRSSNNNQRERAKDEQSKHKTWMSE